MGKMPSFCISAAGLPSSSTLYRVVHSRNVAVGGNAEGCHVGTHESGDVNQDRQHGKKFFLAIITAIKSAGGHARRIKNLVFCFT